MSAELTLTCDLEVTNRAGLHTRVALMIFKKTQEFSGSVTLRKQGTGVTADCRRMIDILALGAAQGDFVTLTVIGHNAESLQKELITLFENKFYEDEYEEERSDEE
ncbi:MAG: HPr family phosphocarrier protein [Planctomycetaceae bacterium]|nr:HPr family phosphocarrier protein [Planctomycetaceae bacterium]